MEMGVVGLLDQHPLYIDRSSALAALARFIHGSEEKGYLG